MATAKKLPSGSWRAQAYDYTDASGKRHYVSFTAPTKKEAEYMSAQFMMEKQSSFKGDMTFKEALTAYIDQRRPVLSPGSIREYVRCIKNYDDINNIRISQITQDLIQQHVNSFSKDHAPKSVRDNHALITAVLSKYRPNFALNTTLPQKRRPNLYVPTDEDIKKVMNVAAGSKMEVPILLAAFGPMRRGEICALEYDDISGTRVHVQRSMVMDENRQYVIKQPKSYAGDRFIDFPEFIIDKIPKSPGRITDLNPNMITQRFNHILKRAGVPHFRFHDCRHYCASIMHAIGVPDAYIMERGGWGSDAVLKNVYRHTIDDKRSQMMNKTNSYFESMQHEMQHDSNVSQ